MPNAVTTRPAKVKRAENSPCVKAAPRKQKKTAQIQDKSQWRCSKIVEGFTINKSRALAEYHLSNKDLGDLTYTIKKSGDKRRRDTMKYLETAVEAKAWEKYGGPEGFDKMLKDKALKFYERYKGNPDKRFPQPRTYEVPDDSVPAPSICKLSRSIPDTETSTPKLVQIKEWMREKGEIWLWNALNQRIFECEDNGHDLERHFKATEREALMLSAYNTLRDYPKRPISLPPSNSSSFKNLNDLLAQAPSNQEGSKYDEPALEITEDMRTGTVSVGWKKWYKDKLKGCLDDVSKEHGIEGLERAQWLVYDKYVECNMGGIVYHRPNTIYIHCNKWLVDDTAKFWLVA